jgi:hypothetical protein
MRTAEEAVNEYLVETFQVCLEEVIADASDGKVRPELAEAVQVTASRLDRWRDDDGALIDLCEGTLTLRGARYAWRASIYTDADQLKFVADVGEFRPMDWKAQMRLVQPPGNIGPA